MTPRLTIVEAGRDGELLYEEGGRTIRGYWEFGGGDAVTILSMGTAEEWSRGPSWAMDGRARILRFVADEAIRQKAPACVAEIDEDSGVIQLRLRPGETTPRTSPARDNQAKAAKFVRRYSELRSMFSILVLGAAAIAAAIFWFGKQSLTVAPASGVPLNDSVRFEAAALPGGGGIASLIQSTDPHLPNWSGRGGGETVSVAMMIAALDGSAPRVVPVASGLSPNALSLSRILGSDGTALWFDAAGLFGIRLSDGKLIKPEDLAAANPTLDAKWWDDQRGMDIVDGKLHANSPDRAAAIAVDPETWIATPAAPKIAKGRFDRYDHGDVLTPIEGNGLKDAALLRMDAKSKPLALTSPDGALRVHTSADGILAVSRLDQGGNAVWIVETGLYRFSLERIFPGQTVTAFVGSRPPVPGKLSEPLIVLIDNASGKMTSHTMWR